MELKCEIVEEAENNLLCNDWQDWADEVRLNVWIENDDGSLSIDEAARREEIAKRAYFRWKDGSGNDLENWLQAEKEVDAALLY